MCSCLFPLQGHEDLYDMYPDDCGSHILICSNIKWLITKTSMIVFRAWYTNIYIYMYLSMNEHIFSVSERIFSVSNDESKLKYIYCIFLQCFSCLTTWFITWSNPKFRTFSPCTVHAPHDGTAAHSAEARLGNEATALDAIPALGVPGAAQPTMVQRIVMEKMRIQQCWMYGNINDNDCHMESYMLFSPHIFA